MSTTEFSNISALFLSIFQFKGDEQTIYILTISSSKQWNSLSYSVYVINHDAAWNSRYIIDRQQTTAWYSISENLPNLKARFV